MRSVDAVGVWEELQAASYLTVWEVWPLARPSSAIPLRWTYCAFIECQIYIHINVSMVYTYTHVQKYR